MTRSTDGTRRSDPGCMKCSWAGFLRRRRMDGPFTPGDLIANFGPVPLAGLPNWLQTFVPSYLLCPS